MISRADNPRAIAKRPANLALTTKRLAGILKTPLETFDAQLTQLVIPPPHRAWYFAAG